MPADAEIFIHALTFSSTNEKTNEINSTFTLLFLAEKKNQKLSLHFTKQFFLFVLLTI